MLFELSGCDDKAVAEMQNELKNSGAFCVSDDMEKKITELFWGGCCSDAQTLETIGNTYKEYGYLCDTHTAVAFHVAAQKKREGVPMVVLSTASPFKFPRSVLTALGQSAPENDFEAMQQLEAATAHTAPASLAALRQKPERFSTVIEPAQIAEVALGYQE